MHSEHRPAPGRGTAGRAAPLAASVLAAALLLLLAGGAPPAAAQAQAKSYSTAGAGTDGGKAADGQAAPATGASADARPAAGGQGGAPDRVVSTRDPYRDDPELRAVGERFATRFDGMSVVAVRRTPFGLFEVQVGMDLLYTDANVSYVMDGRLIDAASRRDLTRERLESVSAIPFDELPLDLALKQVRGDGKRRVAIFEDPNCGYCKQLRHTLVDVDNVTIYTFLYPILAPDSRDKVRDVWCAGDPLATWDAWMLDGRTPPRADCSVPVDEMLALGQRLMVRGTPTLLFPDGSRVSGAIPLAALQARLK